MARSVRRRLAVLGCVLALVAGLLLAGPHIVSAAFTSSTNALMSISASNCFYRATVQKGSVANTTNGTSTVAITSVDMSKAFLLFSTSHNSNRPVASLVTGRIASATTVEFKRVTDEPSPALITIEWNVVAYTCGVSVQRGVTTPGNPGLTTDVTITPVNSTTAAFVTWSKTAEAANTTWGANDPLVGDLTSTSNLQFRQDATSAGLHDIWWQVIEFTDPTKINVQRGCISNWATTSTTATLTTSVTTTRSFVFLSARRPDSIDIGSGMARARLTDATTVTIDRSVANYNVTEACWQVVELKEGSTVQSGSSSLGSGTASTTAAITAVTLARSTAFASTQTGGGQNGGSTAYTADDILGVGSATLVLTSTTQLTIARASTLAAADIAWSVVSWGLP